jgi:glycosyltransferase involved in cell wall biosynthesis
MAPLSLAFVGPADDHVLLVTPAGTEQVPVPDIDERVRYFSEVHRYADRVYHALDELARRTHLDAVVFAHDGAAGFTAIRAKRTLGKCPDTRLVVRLQTPAALVREVVGQGPTDFPEEIRLYAEDYTLTHADVVVTPTDALDRWVRQRFGRPTVRIDPPVPDAPAGPADGPPELLYLGDLSPAKGADRFVALAEHIAEGFAARNADLRFRLLGADTSTDPFGRSYQAHLARRMPPALADRLTFEPPSPVPAGAFCLFPARCDHAPIELLRAMAAGATVVVDQYEGLSELVEDGVSGRVVDTDDAAAVAEAVLALCDDPATRRRLGEGARRVAHERHSPAVFRARLAAAIRQPQPHRQARAPVRPEQSVSVVIPVFRQVRYLHETVASVRASQHGDVEIVVVDDGSADPAVDDVLAGLHDDPDADVHVVRRATNGGVAAARNSGIAASSGRFVMPLDGDDLLDPTYVPKALAALRRNPDLAYVGCYSQNFGLLDTTYVPVGYVPNLMLFLHTDGRCTKLFDRAAIEAVGGYDEDLPAFEDWDMYLRLADHGFAGDVLPETLFRYRRHRESTVFSWSNDIRIELLQHLARKHRHVLADRYEAVVLNLLHLWKTHYEVSESVLLQTQWSGVALDPGPQG